MSSSLPRIKILPPLYFLFALLLGYLLETIYPTHMLNGEWYYYSGLGLIIVSILLAIWSVKTFKQAGTPMNVRKPATQIVVNGPYAISRNPLYLSDLLVSFGIVMMADMAWGFIFLLLIIPVFQHHVIKPEENYLVQIFGNEYRGYKRKVRCWL